MPNGTRTRDWATFDYYALLGVDTTADADEITRAFREVAKRCHPDATDPTDDTAAAAAARFSDVTAAYAVLGDRDTRRAYDQVRADHGRAVPVPRMGPPPRVASKPKRKPWSARKSLTVLFVGVIVALLGIGAGLLTWSMHESSARQRARFVPVVATRGDAENGGSIASFLTRDGERYRVPAPEQHGDPSGHGLTLNIRYDPANPEHVIVDSGTFGRDITFTIVSLKLLLGGLFLAGTGWKRYGSATAVR
jgi:curved DNA-binding protein CbpA